MNRDRQQELRHLSTETHADPGWSGGEAALAPGVTVLWHPDPTRVGERAALPALRSGRGVSLSRLEPELVAPGGELCRPLEDPHLSRKPLRLEPGDAGGVVIDAAGTPTRLAADGVPLSGRREVAAAELAHGVVLLLADRVVLLLHLLDPLAEPDLPRHGLVGESPAVLRLCREIRQVADLDVPVLIRGETGTGKELLAAAIHRAGPRRVGPYVAVNLAGVPPTVAASELFGAARGAFTGSDRTRRGYFERAAGGSLFLDEIGDAPADVQNLLLRALETGEIQPLGAETPRPVDVRLTAATDGDLESAVRDGHFRGPLLHRLSGFVLEIPPLRARRQDIGRLLVHFLRQELDTVGEAHRLAPPAPGQRPWLPAPLVARLALHRWPGNVRQLRNVVRDLVVGSRGRAELVPRPTVERMLAEVAPSTGEVPPHVPPSRPDQISEDELRVALRACRWRPFAAARRLGISRGSIYDLMAKCPDIRTATDLTAEEIEAARSGTGGSVEAMAEKLEVSALGLRRRMKQLGLDPGAATTGRRC